MGSVCYIHILHGCPGGACHAPRRPRHTSGKNDSDVAAWVGVVSASTRRVKPSNDQILQAPQHPRPPDTMKRCAAQAGCVQNQWFSGAQVHRTLENVARRKFNVSQTNGKVGNRFGNRRRTNGFLGNRFGNRCQTNGKVGNR